MLSSGMFLVVSICNVTKHFRITVDANVSRVLGVQITLFKNFMKQNVLRVSLTQAMSTIQKQLILLNQILKYKRYMFFKTPGSLPEGVEMLGSTLVNHRLTTPRCKNGTNEYQGDRISAWNPMQDICKFKETFIPFDS